MQGQEGGGGVGIETTRRAPFTPTTPPSHLFPSHLSCTSFLPPPLKREPTHPCAQRFQMGCSALVPIRPPRFEGYRLHCRTPRRPAWHAPAEDGAGHGDHGKTVGDGGAGHRKYDFPVLNRSPGYKHKAVLCSGCVWSYPKRATGGYNAPNTALRCPRTLLSAGLGF